MAYETQPIAATASLTLNRNTHAGNVLVGNAAAGMTVTLPASTGKGDRYKILVGTTISSNNCALAAASRFHRREACAAVNFSPGISRYSASARRRRVPSVIT